MKQNIPDKNPKLGAAMILAVGEQLNSGELPFVNDVFLSLQRKGCNRKQAKTMIASVLLEEMYYILKGERTFDEVQYESNLRKMNRKTLNSFSVPNVTLEIETQFKDRCKDIWNAVEHEDEAAASTLFLEIWPEIKEYIVENLYRTTATGVEKATLADVAPATEYEVELEELLSEIGIVLLNMHRYEECISFSQDVLELFSWDNDDPDIFKINIGDALAGMDRMDECDAWYEN